MANNENSGFKKVIQSTAFKGISIAVASALIGAGITYLATNNNSENKALVTMKGDPAKQKQTQEFLAKQNVTFTRLDEKGNVYHD